MEKKNEAKWVLIKSEPISSEEELPSKLEDIEFSIETDVEKFNKELNNKNIIVTAFREHSKASEKYVDVRILHNDFIWEGSIPYFYRRTGLAIRKTEELIEYLNKIYPLFSKESIDKFIEGETKRWNEEMSGKEITKGFFDKLINMKWNSVKYDLPSNSNSARRIQDIKEFGYTLATDTKKMVSGKNQSDTHFLLIPIPKGGATGYEIMSKIFKDKVIKVLKTTNIYELSSANKHGLLPDHKFPEIRWDEKTKDKNSEKMTDDEIKKKFQLLDNQRNQQKREICRKCYQTGKRGKLFGLNYFYRGNELWDDNIQKNGKEAEKGCIGCGWYDIQAWRESLNNEIDKKK